MQRKLKVSMCLLGAVIGLALPVNAAPQTSGETVYRTRCASCHELVDSRIPHREALQKMSASRILRSLDFGIMISVAYPLRRDEREAVAAYLGLAGDTGSSPGAKAFCADRNIQIATNPKSQWNGWSPTATNARFQNRAAAGLTPDQLQRLKLKWAFGFDGDVNAFAQPTILDQHLFVGSAGGQIHALSVETGCIKWVFQADGPVRSAILAVPSGQRHVLLFGDQTGWFYALEAETGRLIWKKKIEDHEAARLTGAPVAYQGNVFVPVASWEETRALNPDYPCCTFRGSVVALRIRDGSQVWKTFMVPQPKVTGKTRIGTATWGPSGVGVWSAPTVDSKRGVLYVTTGDNYSSPATDASDAVVALNLNNGRIVWSKQTTLGDAYNSSCGNAGPSCPEENGPDYDYGASALMVQLSNGRELLVAGQKSGMVYALDPDRKGEVVWQTRVGKGGINGGVQWGMASDGQNIYAAVSDLIRTRRTPDPSDPIAVDLNTREGGGLTALRPANGEKTWYAAPTPCPQKPGCSPAQSAAVTAIPGIIFSGSVDGHLRGFSAEDGTVVWDIDTAREYETVNGVKARGGSIDGPGVVVVGGMVFVNSGYARNGGMPGNVLLAFGPEN